MTETCPVLYVTKLRNDVCVCVYSWTAGAVMWYVWIFLTSQAFSKITLVVNMISSINETASLASISTQM